MAAKERLDFHLERRVIPQLPGFYFGLDEIRVAVPPEDPVSYREWQQEVKDAIDSKLRSMRSFVPDFT